MRWTRHDGSCAVPCSVEHALAFYLKRTATAFATAQSADDVAGVVLHSLESPNPAFRVQTSAAAAAFVGVKVADLDGSGVTGLTAGWVGA